MFDINEIKKNVKGKLTRHDDNNATHTESDISAPTPLKNTQSKQLAVVGPSIHIKGELSGEEGLIIEGSVEGTIDLKENQLIIGESGNIKADVFAKSIKVDGALRGELHGLEKVHISRNGRVEGDIHSPRVILEDGARFKGSIDMSGTAKGKAGSVAQTDKVMPMSS